MPTMRVPDRFVPAFAMLRDMSLAMYASLLQAISGANPTLRSSALAASICEGSDFAPDEVGALVDALTSLAGLRRVQDVSADEMSHRVAASPDLETPEHEQEAFAGRITELAESTPIRLLGKALDMGTEHDRVFVAARILTDLRPIFGDDVTEPPEGALLSHTLKFEFVHDEGNFGNFYIVLDEEDLKNLDGLISRARQKAASLKSTLEAAGLTYMGLEN